MGGSVMTALSAPAAGPVPAAALPGRWCSPAGYLSMDISEAEEEVKAWKKLKGESL